MQPLTKDLIDKPSLYSLTLLIEPGCVHAAINTTLQDNAMIYRRIELDASMQPLAAIEDLIYENPLLLADFRKVDVLVSNCRYTMVPTAMAADDARQAVLSALWPDPAATMMAQDMPTADTLLWCIDTGLLSFLRRTFLEASISHAMAPLIKYFSAQSAMSRASRLYCQLRDGSVDLIGLQHGRLAVATTIQATSAADMAYFMLAAARAYGFDPEADEIMLCGSSALRQQCTDRMRPFARHVMPVIFPSEALRAGKDALNAPFPIIILPLCA